MRGVGKGCLPSPRLKGGLEGRGRNRQPSVPWPRAERWCACRLHPSHLSATLKPDYSRLMSARQGPATRCSRIPSLRGQITPACTGPFRVGFAGRPGRRGPRPGTLSPTRRLLHPSHVLRETSLRRPPRDGGGCREVAVPRPAAGGLRTPWGDGRRAGGSPGCRSGTRAPRVHRSRRPCCSRRSQPWDEETRRDAQPPHRAARGTRDDLKTQEEGERQGRGLN